MSILSMTKTLFKNLQHGPYTVLYPIKKKESFERTRGRIAISIDDCIFCSMCQRRCPTGAIKVDKANSSWSIERLQCIQCNYCSEVCPKKCLTMENQYTSPSFGNVRDEFIKCMNTQSLSE
ncbi:MAG: 4Fe-4S ferredoxin iron-sulfur binding domain protein [Herbinix sp.]|jgi:formate hydrogenlyase subunit 6/NADH:ubiquinone oxidoreductase subunit I|nr:4Fe-4S ferredoxin iron-sulfur binding domain protein [Herbinix sp.]